MPDGLQLLGAFLGAALLVAALVPVAIRTAVRTDFLDRPAGYKAHAQVTPYLGGVALIAGFTVTALIGEGFDGLPLILGVAVVLAAVGTLDDRIGLGVGIRFAIQLGAALVLWVDDIGWEVTDVTAVDLLITVVWVVGIANAFNLLDNIDGSTGITAATSAAGIGGLALVADAVPVAAAAFALSGACVGFLLFNLASPAKIFLGDGGSVPVGFVLAALAMVVPYAGDRMDLVAAIPLVGVAIFDTSLVVISRRRRGVQVLSGGRDHATHRMLARLGGPRRVALVLAAVQGALCASVIFAACISEGLVYAVTVAYVVIAVVGLIRVEGRLFANRNRATGQPV